MVDVLLLTPEEEKPVLVYGFVPVGAVDET